MDLEQRVAELEKEIAELKLQLEARPEKMKSLVKAEIEVFFKGMTFGKWDSMVKK